MSMFSKYSAADAASPEPFNHDRWDAVLTSMEINFEEDEDGDRVADWDGMRLWFLVEGSNNDVMAIRSAWDIRPPLDAMDDVVAAINFWNANRFWPKASAVAQEDTLQVFGDLVVDIETGVTDDFLRQQVRCMVSTSGQLFEHLGEQLPAAKDWFSVSDG